MKATNNTAANILKSLVIVSGIFFFSFNNAYAGGLGFNPRVSGSLSGLLSALAPSTPREADFEESLSSKISNYVRSAMEKVSSVTEDLGDSISAFVGEILAEELQPSVPPTTDINDSELGIAELSPLTPSVPASADFSDATLNAEDFISLAPQTPAEADFNETAESMMDAGLAPATPAEADFNDSDITNSDLAALAPSTPSFADFND
jgi:hypothetical protein